MTQSTSDTPTQTSSLATSGSKDKSGELVTSQGKTVIADTVVAKIAGIATREINGVHDVGGGAARIVGRLRDNLPGTRTNISQGISVEVGEKQAAIDIGLVADYGVRIQELAAGVRRNVIKAIEGMTGLEVVEVNITVHDIYFEGEDDDTDSGSSDSSESDKPRVE